MNFVTKTLYDDKAVAFGIMSLGAIAVVAGAATLYVGMLVNNQVYRSIDQTQMSDYNTSQNCTIATTDTARSPPEFDCSVTLATARTNATTAFTLIGVGLIVTGAAIILSVIKSGF